MKDDRRGGPRATAPRRAAGDYEAVRRSSRQRPHRPRHRARRGARAARRERRRQVDPGQDPLRRRRAVGGRDLLGGTSGHDRFAGRGARARPRHGVPALLAVRRADGGREHRRRPVGRMDAEGRAGQAGRGEPRLRSHARTGPGGLDLVGRRAAADRDRPLPAPEPEAADPRRADLGADAAGIRAPLQDARHACRLGLRDPLHLPQARGGPPPLPQRDDPPRRARGRDARSARAERTRDRRPHGRRRGGRGPERRSPRLDGRDSARSRSVAGAREHPRQDALRDRSRGARGRGRRNRRRCRQRPERVLRRALGRAPGRAPGRDRHRRARLRHSRHRRPPAPRRRLRAGRAPRTRRRADPFA